ncbi:MAG: 7,8-didemethyl-8-hydroxy-5-deazariboflavin synthase subunit CofH, partial [Nitrosopumilales archaeon CG_4_10_14_0_8_um_filter_34_8]
NQIDNIQMSWVKEGQKMSQLLLMWGANDFGGTLINESISTSAGANHGQLIKPKEIRRLVKEIGRVPAERNTNYKILKKFDSNYESDDELDKISDLSKFGSYAELIKINKFRYKNPRKDN